MRLSKLSLRSLLMLVCASVATIPLIILSVIVWRSTATMTETSLSEFKVVAVNVGDKIDRNLFERYGDVQAFGLNTAIQDQDAWYVQSESSPIVRAMNQYVDTYDIYYMTILVDMEGQLIAVNTRDDSGDTVNTESLYEQNFAQEDWFQDAAAGRFYESEDGSFSGTVVEHLYVDSDVAKIYGDEGLSLGFTAPVRDENGETIAIWKNVAKFGLVEEIVFSSYQGLASRGLEQSEITLLDETGNVILDCDPSSSGSNGIVRNMSVIGKLNLATKGVLAAQKVIAGESGTLVSSYHARKQVDQCASFSPLTGALGFPGMKWNVLVRAPSDVILATANQMKTVCVATFLGALVLILAGSYYIASSISKVVGGTIDSMHAAENRDYSVRVESSLCTDLNRMTGSLNGMLDSLSAFEERAADCEGQVAALSRSQAVIEFELDGTITQANDNFLNAVGYSLDEIKGKHHRMFVDPSYAQSIEYTQFWDTLRSGNFQSGEYKRFGKNGKEIWIQASYNPISDMDGKTVKVVKYAADVTAMKMQSANHEGQINALNNSQAVIEFNMDGTILEANKNFLGAVGYSLEEIKGRHHRMFVDAEYGQSPAYTQFWEKLGRGEFESAEYKRFGKGGKEIWIQASYNPIFDMNGKPFKVVKFASDITAQVVGKQEQESRDSKIAEFQALEVEKVSAVMAQVASGDLTQRYNVSDGDADTKATQSTFASIADALNNMCSNLREVIGSVTMNAERLSSTSNGLSATASQLTSGAAETTNQSTTVASAAEEMATNMRNMSGSTEQMTSNVNSVAKSVEELTSSISEIAKTAEQSSSIASRASTLTQSSNETIGQLGSAAEEIGKVIEVIQDIAEQTNLLALNATIEAARAGEAGKGFAVVATEVKELARQTAGATEDIRNRIQIIQGSTTEAVRSIKEVGDVIEEVNQTSGTIASAVEEQSILTQGIAENINETAQQTSAVATGVAESATACDEVAKSITSVDEASRQTSQGAAETESIGHSLLTLSEELGSLVGQFKIEADAASATAGYSNSAV